VHKQHLPIHSIVADYTSLCEEIPAGKVTDFAMMVVLERGTELLNSISISSEDMLDSAESEESTLCLTCMGMALACRTLIAVMDTVSPDLLPTEEVRKFLTIKYATTEVLAYMWRLHETTDGVSQETAHA
jgi:hypothetical protein